MIDWSSFKFFKFKISLGLKTFKFKTLSFDFVLKFKTLGLKIVMHCGGGHRRFCMNFKDFKFSRISRMQGFR